jgi:hypothetical protein
MSIVLTLALFQLNAVVLENPFVRVTRDSAPCANAAPDRCADRVIVALSPVELTQGSTRRKLNRGDIAVFVVGDKYQAPTGGHYFEVAFKPKHPAVPKPPQSIPAAKNTVLHDGPRLFIFEEKLAVGDTRAKHSHGPRVVIQLNRTRLRQWLASGADVTRDIEPDTATFNSPVIHTVKNVGKLPLRGIVIEVKPTAK